MYHRFDGGVINIVNSSVQFLSIVNFIGCLVDSILIEIVMIIHHLISSFSLYHFNLDSLI